MQGIDPEQRTDQPDEGGPASDLPHLDLPERPVSDHPPKPEDVEVDTSNSTAHADIQPEAPHVAQPSGQDLHEIPTLGVPQYVVNNDPTPDQEFPHTVEDED
jgi:hypothetical protein